MRASDCLMMARLTAPFALNRTLPCGCCGCKTTPASSFSLTTFSLKFTGMFSISDTSRRRVLNRMLYWYCPSRMSRLPKSMLFSCNACSSWVMEKAPLCRYSGRGVIFISGNCSPLISTRATSGSCSSRLRITWLEKLLRERSPPRSPRRGEEAPLLFPPKGGVEEALFDVPANVGASSSFWLTMR